MPLCGTRLCSPPKCFRIPPHGCEECVFLKDGLQKLSEPPCDPPQSSTPLRQFKVTAISRTMTQPQFPLDQNHWISFRFPTTVPPLKLFPALFFYCCFPFLCIILQSGWISFLSTDNVQRECYPGEWPCPSSGLCIPLDKLCDGMPNCPDGEDETNTTAGRNCS